MIVGIGEVLWDVYPDGARLGGAPANFACQAAALGAESWIASAVGTDDLGDRAVEQLHALGARVDHIVRDREHATGRVNVTLDREKRPTFEIAMNAAWDHIPWSAGLEALAARADAVCFGTLAQRSPQSRDALTRGPEGAILVAGDEESSEPAPAVRVVDTVGAGDAFAAALVCDVLRGLPLAEINRHANAVAAFVCSRPGATVALPHGEAVGEL